MCECECAMGFPACQRTCLAVCLVCTDRLLVTLCLLCVTSGSFLFCLLLLLFQLMLDRGLDPDLSRMGISLLHVAAQSGSALMVKLLLRVRFSNSFHVVCACFCVCVCVCFCVFLRVCVCVCVFL